MLYLGGHFKYDVLHTAADAVGNGLTQIVTDSSDGGMCRWGVQVSGTFSATVTFEGTIDGANWVAIAMLPVADIGTPTTTATGAGMFIADVKGLSAVRARISAYTSGSVTVAGQLVA